MFHHIVICYMYSDKIYMQVNLDEVQGIFAEDNAQLKTLLEKYSVDSVERCAR